MIATYCLEGRGISRNAEFAKRNGRFPKTQAAKVLGVSVEAFKKGCLKANYFPREYHHTGKYANCTTFYDTNEVINRWEFWFGVALSYKGKKKKEFLQKTAEVKLAQNLSSFEIKRSRNKGKWVRQDEVRIKYRLGFDFHYPEHLSDESILAKINEVRLAKLKKMAQKRNETRFKSIIPTHDTFDNAIKCLKKLGFETKENKFVKGEIVVWGKKSNWNLNVKGFPQKKDKLGRLIPAILAVCGEKHSRRTPE